MTVAAEISGRLQLLGNPEKARLLQRYFKTAPGEYAAGDVFVGVTVPTVRRETRDTSHISIRRIGVSDRNRGVSLVSVGHK